jgi:hypothetical protein
MKNTHEYYKKQFEESYRATLRIEYKDRQIAENLQRQESCTRPAATNIQMSAPVVPATRTTTHNIQANTVNNISVPNNSRVTHRTPPHTQVSAENANNILFVVNNRLLVNNNLMANNIQAQNCRNKFSLLNTY